MRRNLVLVLLCLVCVSRSLRLPQARRSPRLSCSRLDSEEDRSTRTAIREHLQKKEFKLCYELLQSNPLLHLDLEDAKALLNGMQAMDVGEETQETIDMASFLYKRLARQRVLRGFGCIEGDYPESGGDISPAKLEEVSGIPISALTPKERTTYWRLAGIVLCLAEYAVGERLGIDPLYTLIPATFAVFLSDQFFLKGAAFETVYQRLFPEYRKKVIYHEAGHFLLAYLLGVPVRDCITSAWEARRNKEIKGQAGTVFYDTRVAEELASQKISRSSINRLSVIIMAGIAAEANHFGRAEGGIADEQSLVPYQYLASLSTHGGRR